MTPDAKDLCVFAVKRGDMKNRLDINYNLPQYTMLEEKLYQTFGENLKRISDIADVICGPFGSAIKNTDYLFSSEVEVLLKESGCEYAKHDVDLRREDRRGNHPTIDVLGDYDVIGLNTTQKRIFIIECKVLQPIGSVFEHSNQQKRFFTKEKFDEKFQKRIDYFSKVAMSFFANHGYDTEGFTINPYMVVNKVFSSYYKHVQFPIVTFDELKREIQL